MQDQGGFVKIYRKMTEWEWYDDVNTKVVFLHILLKANWKEKKWHGETILAGEWKTTVREICEQLNMTPKAVRVALDHLKGANTVTVRTTSKNTIITVNNWDFYQREGNQTANEGRSDGKQRADKRQTKGERAANTLSLYIEEGEERKASNNDNNEKKEKNGGAPFPSRAEIREYFDMMDYSISPERFFDYYEARGWRSRGEPIADWRRLADNWQKTERPGAEEVPSRYTTFDIDEVAQFGILC